MRALTTFFLSLVLACGWARAAEDVPDWVRQAAASAIPTYSPKVTSVVLLRDESVTVDSDGRWMMRERGAVKILQPSDETVEAFRTYNTKNGRIRDFQGWLIPPSGKPIPYAKNRVLDVALSRDYVYDEARAKVLQCGTAAPGSVFAWEVTEEEKTVFTQDAYAFQGRSPVLVSRFTLTMPAGWEAKGTVFNHAPVEPQVSGSTYTWELRDLAWIEREDHSPTLAALAPRLAVSYFPPEGNPGGLRGLKDWASVSAWLSPLVDPQAEVTEAIRDKAMQLTANAPGELDKINAIAAFVQQTNYVEVSLNITRGGGYTPHPSEETLSRNYGDCKDKATLMRALLKAVGIDSYLVTITADDRTYVRPEWASPMQFNHAIVAVRVSNAVTLPSVLEKTALGRLLIFDPTNPMTPVGDLPQDEQGSHALVIAGANGALLAMPLLPPSARRIDSTAQASLDTAGRLDARIQRQYFGQSAVSLRAVQRLEGNEELKKSFERGLSRRMRGTTLKSVDMKAHPQDNGVSVNLDLVTDRFGQIMQDRLLVVRPGLLASGGDYFFASQQRTSPVELETDLRHDSIRIKLPAGFKLDELPDAAKIESPYGTLQASWAVKDGEIVMDESLEIKQTLAPAAEYPQIRDFFERVNGAQFAPVVLVKQ